jgi:hypothetical protein
MAYGMTEHYFGQCRDKNQTWYCPAGHPIVYGCNEAERLRRELADKEWKRAQLEKELFHSRDFARNQSRLRVRAENKLAKQTERVAKGVCPGCKRSFADLARHMATKHPEQLPKQPRQLP